MVCMLSMLPPAPKPWDGWLNLFKPWKQQAPVGCDQRWSLVIDCALVVS